MATAACITCALLAVEGWAAIEGTSSKQQTRKWLMEAAAAAAIQGICLGEAGYLLC
jgi:hypothetical protein